MVPPWADVIVMRRSGFWFGPTIPQEIENLLRAIPFLIGHSDCVVVEHGCRRERLATTLWLGVIRYPDQTTAPAPALADTTPCQAAVAAARRFRIHR